MQRIAASLLFLLTITVHANGSEGGPYEPTGSTMASLSLDLVPGTTGDSAVHQENERLVAALLAIALGPFGAHRLYLGTSPKVPIVYGITLGGFGILAVIDLVHILFTRDLARYHQNDRVFMWARPHKPLTPP